jgi:lysophosphatidylcholine acyltransferase / lyso-PAF acetyltransferase
MAFCGFLAKVISTIFVDRRGIDATWNPNSSQPIRKRQKYVEETGTLPPVAIFPEGTTNNNQYILPFKRGAFEAKTTVIPVTFEYRHENAVVGAMTGMITEV